MMYENSQKLKVEDIKIKQPAAACWPCHDVCRYQKLLSVLQQLNLRLDDVYKQLTGGAGSAYCAYTQVGDDDALMGARCHILVVLF